MGERRWFEAEVSSSHLGTGKRETHYNYVFAEDVIDALNRLLKMRGWHRVKNRSQNAQFPSIRPLSEEEIHKLEEEITTTPSLTIRKAKKSGFYGRRKED